MNDILLKLLMLNIILIIINIITILFVMLKIGIIKTRYKNKKLYDNIDNLYKSFRLLFILLNILTILGFTMIGVSVIILIIYR